MQKNHPENIDDIENFYRDQLKDLDIEPPAEIWNNISTKLQQPTKPFYKTSGFFVGLTATLVAIVTLFLIQSSQNDQKVIDDFKKDHHLTPEKDSQQPVDEPTKSSSEKAGQTISTQKNNTNKPGTNTTVVVTPKDSVRQQETSDIPADTKINTDSETKTEEKTTENKTETKTEKKPKSFFEKQTEAYKDSTRQLFVPKK